MTDETERKSDKPPPSAETVREVFPPKTEPETLRLDIAPAAIVKVILGILALQFCVAISRVFIVVAFALMLTAAFNPVVRKLQARLNRTWAVLLLVLVGVGAIVGLIALLAPAVVQQTGLLLDRLPGFADDLETALRNHHIPVGDLANNLRGTTTNLLPRIQASFPHPLDAAGSVIQNLAYGLVTIVLSIYLLIEGPRVGSNLSSLLPRDKRLGARRMVAEMGTQVGGYVRGQLIASALAGAFSCILLSIVQVPQALALGALAAVMDVVPMVGILVATLAAVLMALTLSTSKALIVLVAYVCYHQIESHVIVPTIYGNTLGLSLSVIVVSILVGVELLGITGAVLALPVAAAIPSLVAYVHEWQEEKEPSPDGKSPLP